MKKKLMLLSVIAICICLVGCGKKEETKENTKKSNTSVRVRSTINISLRDIEGYDVDYDLDDESIVKITDRNSDEHNSKLNAKNTRINTRAMYSVKALKEGTAKITFKLTNKDDSNDVKEAIYKVIVDKNLNITETHSGSYFEK